MITMNYCFVAAAFAVNVIMILVHLVFSHVVMVRLFGTLRKSLCNISNDSHCQFSTNQVRTGDEV